MDWGVLEKFGGLEIWNAKYLAIPHSFLKIKNMGKAHFIGLA